jgi:CspA family cold shock protein
MARLRGNVKWFDTEKGWGFIRLEDGEEVFVHHSDIQGEGFRSLKDGAEVELEVERADRGPRARKVVRIGSDGAPVSTASADESGRSANDPAGPGHQRGRRSDASRTSRRGGASRGESATTAERAASRADRGGAGNGLPTLDEQVRTRLAPRFRFDD